MDNSNYKLIFFGCSFTAMETSLTGHMFNNFRNIISEKLTCSSLNISKDGKSNEQIIDDIYNSNKFNRDEDTIFIIQFTFNNRLGMYFDLEDRFISMCKRENPDNPMDKIKIDFYTDWLKYFYSRQTRIKEFKKQVDLLCAWLKLENIKFICFGMDNDMDSEYFESSFYERNNFLNFENTHSLYGYASLNKLRISDDSKYSLFGEARDWHLNKEGHIYLANKISENLNNKNWVI